MKKTFCDKCKVEMRFHGERTAYATPWRFHLKPYHDGSTNMADLCDPCMANVLEQIVAWLRQPPVTYVEAV